MRYFLLVVPDDADLDFADDVGYEFVEETDDAGRLQTLVRQFCDPGSLAAAEIQPTREAAEGDHFAAAFAFNLTGELE